MIRIFKIADGDVSVKDIAGDLKSLQDEVGGSKVITLCPYWPELEERGIDLFVDDNGLFVERPTYSLAKFDDEFNKIKYGVFGNAVFASHDDEGNTIGLTDEQIKFISDHIRIGGFFTYNYDIRVTQRCYEFDFGGEE